MTRRQRVVRIIFASIVVVLAFANATRSPYWPIIYAVTIPFGLALAWLLWKMHRLTRKHEPPSSHQ
jgi:uncharacterized membrane protein YcaP (DUF421 family)